MSDLWQNYQGGTLVNGIYTQGRPTTVTVFNSPLSRSPQLRANIGIFAQDQWVLNRFTVNLGLRWEYLKEDVPAQDRVAGRFAPAQHYDAINCETMPGMTCWKSWSPRLGVAYDLFGDGKTALKASFGQYMTPDSSAFANLFNPVATFTENRNWTDLNGDDIAQDNEIATSNNPSFGKITGRTLDPNFSREYNRQISAGVQHQLRTGMAVTFNWYRRSLYNTAFTLNRAVDPLADWTTSSVVNPLDGSPITIYQIKQNKATGIAPDLYLTNMTDTNLRRNTYTGFEVGSSARLPRRATMFLGWTFERTVDVDCTMNTASASATLNSPNSLRYCDQSGQTFQELGVTAPIPFRHEFKINASVPLVYGFEASASFQSYAGAQKATTGGLSWTITPSATRYPVDCTVCPAGTPFVLASRFSGDPGVTVQLVPSGVRFLPRWNQLDLGLRRSFRINGITAQAQMTLFNALNSNAVLGEGTGLTTRLNPLLASGLTDPNFTYVSNDPGKGGTPNSILQPRLIQLGMQLKF